MSKLKKLASCLALICMGLTSQFASATSIDRNFTGGACVSENGQGVLRGVFVCDDDGKTYFSSITDVYKHLFRVTHIHENKTVSGGSTVSIIVEKK